MINKVNILELLRKNDEEAYIYIYDNYFSILYKQARKIIKDQESAQEVAHHTIIKLWEKRNEVEIESNVLGYLLRAVHRNSLNYIRDEKHRSNKIDLVATSQTDCFTPDFTTEMEIILKMEEVLQEEDDLRQQIFRLNRFEGFTAKEVASKLNLNVGKVKYDIMTMVQKMQIHLTEFLPIIILSIVLLDFIESLTTICVSFY